MIEHNTRGTPTRPGPTPLPPGRSAANTARAESANPAQAARSGALRRLTALKKVTAAASVFVFFLLGGTIMVQHTATPAASAQVAVSSAQNATSSAQNATSSASRNQSNSFFSQSQGGYSFGNTTTPQAPIAGSGTS